MKLTRNTLILWAFTLISLGLRAQHVEKGRSQYWQGSEPWKGQNAFLENFAKKIGYSQTDSVYFRVPVQFWIYRSNTGEGGLGIDEIRRAMADLNYFFALNRTGIQFYPLPTVRYINRSKHRQVRWHGEVFSITQHNKVPGAINVHLIDSIVAKKYLYFGRVTKTFRGLYNTYTRGIVLKKRTSRSSLTHEVGHFFGLQHTHDFYKAGRDKREPVDRQRTATYKGRTVPLCEITGDMLADTPADPNLTWYVNDSCQFEATRLTDLWGDFYHPDVSNLMAYPRDRECRQSFTNSQKAAMLYTAFGDRDHANWQASAQSVPADEAEPDNIAEWATTTQTSTAYTRSLHLNFEGKKWEIDTDLFRIDVKKGQHLAIDITPGTRLTDLDQKQPYAPGSFLAEGQHLIRVESANGQPIRYTLRVMEAME